MPPDFADAWDVVASPRDRRGLEEAEARRRLESGGPNSLQQPENRTIRASVYDAAREPMLLLVAAAALLYLVIGDHGEGLFLIGGVVVTLALVVVQDLRGERALAALRTLAQPSARVIRDGRERRIPTQDLVPGDLVLVGEGERLPADCRLLGGDMLGVDESALTGESATVLKTPGGAGDDARLFAGTLIVRGHAVAEVVLTGARTALGRIGGALAEMDDEPTPLQRSSGRLVRLLGLAALVFCALITAAYGLTRGDWMEAILAGMTFAIALIPEEFPMILTVFMALGAWRLARHNVLVRRAAAVEALGGVTLLCVDKTGTLTENRMELVRLTVDGVDHAIADGLPASGAAVLRTAALASARRSIDPMDRAVLRLSAAPESDPVRSWPLRPEKPVVVQLWSRPEGAFAAAKGAPEAVFRLCRLTPDQAAAQLRAVDRLAGEGLRVLAVAACRTSESFPDDPWEAVFIYEGLLGFVDPLRPDAAAALRDAREAGIAVAMITGDHPATALAIAREAGLDETAGVMTGQDVAALSQEALPSRVRDVRIFARVTPDQKLRLVQAFKAAGGVVAMTGDGVNDAPALEAAHIGIAMGRRGTDVAREAADIVLLDDRFASIIGGVRLGRRIFANLQRALTYVTAIHVPIAGLALAPVLLGLPPLLFPLHVVLLELAVDPICALVFEAEPSERNAMRRPPRPAGSPLFGPRQVIAALAQGAGVLVLVLGLYVWGLSWATEAEARGAAFLALIGGNLMLGLVDSAASARIFARQRRAYWVIVLLMSGAMSLIFSAPPLARMFALQPPGPALLAAAVAVAVLGGGWAVLARLAGDFMGKDRSPGHRAAVPETAPLSG